MASPVNLVRPRRMSPAEMFPDGFSPCWLERIEEDGSAFSMEADTPARYFDLWQAGFRPIKAKPEPAPPARPEPEPEPVVVRKGRKRKA